MVSTKSPGVSGSGSLMDAAAVLEPRDDESESTTSRDSEEASASGSEGPASADILEGPQAFTFYDVFFWRDAPDWYRKTFLSAGFGLSYCVMKQYLNR